MSRIGSKPIEVPKGVTITRENNLITVKGPKGELKQEIARDIATEIEEGQITVTRPTNHRRHRSQHGLARTLISNMVQGVTDGHKKVLEIYGTGYRAAIQGKTLVLNLGYSHDVKMDSPQNVTFEVVAPEKGKAQQIVVSGIDKAQVGQLAADIRKVRKPDPYKGKGVRYQGEVVKLKQGKRATK